MTILKMLKALIVEDLVRVQFVHECLVSAALSKTGRGKDAQEYCKVTIATQHMKPGDYMRNEGNVGIILWVPRERYNELVGK